MYQKLSEEEIEFCEHFYDPVALKETLYPENLKATHLWGNDDEPLYQVRPYQFGWQNYAHMYADDDELDKKENWQRKIGAGTCYNIGSRNTGKSFDFIVADSPLDILYLDGDESCVASFDDSHLNKVSNPITNIFSEHPFFKMYHRKGQKKGVKGNTIEAQNGHTYYGKSEHIASPEPGKQYHGLHYMVFKFEECSYMSESGTEKRIDSGSSLGYIERPSGIPDINVGSPLGDIFHNEKLKPWICRLPQYIREDWDEKQKERMIEKYKGETSLAYKLNVLGEVTFGAEGFWDVEKIKKTSLNKKVVIKRFDIDKKKFKNFKQHIIIDRLPAQQIFVCADIGAGARPTEIIILFYDGKKYKLRYNVILNKLDAKEQSQIFKYLYDILGGAFIGLDATTDYGIARYLKDAGIPEEHIFSIDLRKSVEVDFEKDEDGKVKQIKNKDAIKKVKTIDLAMEELQTLFYQGFMDIPALDQKFFKEFSGFRVIVTGMNKKYGSTTDDDYHQSFQIFSIVRFMVDQNILNNNNDDSCLGIF